MHLGFGKRKIPKRKCYAPISDSRQEEFAELRVPLIFVISVVGAVSAVSIAVVIAVVVTNIVRFLKSF